MVVNGNIIHIMNTKQEVIDERSTLYDFGCG